MQRPYVPVAGTWAARNNDRWHAAGSPLAGVLATLGWHRDADNFPFWDTSLAGVSLCGNSHTAWQFGGGLLAEFLRTDPCGKTAVVIAHSHGGQVAAYAACRQRIRCLITIDTPVRHDMARVWDEAAIDLHVHLYGTGFGSTMRVLGTGIASVLHGRPFRRTIPTADIARRIPGGHSGILRDPAHFSAWSAIVGEVDRALGHSLPQPSRSCVPSGQRGRGGPNGNGDTDGSH